MQNPERPGTAKTPPSGDWPQGGLESVRNCPVCGSARRRVLYERLRDNVFFCAPGDWALHDCLDCGSAYMDPRPSAETLYLAYSTYYTHEEQVTVSGSNLRGLAYVRRLLINGYKNWRFSAKLSPSSWLGVPIILLMPFKRAAIERQYRQLPRTTERGRLLDIGFGSGDFLDEAHAIGWEVTGIDPDAKVVSNALRRGLNVYQGNLEVLAGESNSFDIITMSHVIEHVHKPLMVLEACYRLLKPGGKLWMETPNINSIGRLRFQNNWRGLETPRHLVIFNRQSLRSALNQVGFVDVRDASQSNPLPIIYAASQRMKQGLDPHENMPISKLLRGEIILVRFLGWLLKSRREFVSVTASKPSV
ncbi:MAG: class I SAM-dependent methyltransferase [Steroidobacteraceae bacterium]